MIYYVVYSKFLEHFMVDIEQPPVNPEIVDLELISCYSNFEVALEEAKKKNEGK